MIVITYDKQMTNKMDRMFKNLVKAHAIIPEEHTKRVTLHAIFAVREQIAGQGLIKTGQFYDSVNGRVFKNGKNSWMGVVGAPSPAQFLEAGTKPHTIRVKNKKVLHWIADDGSNAFAKEVRHPGTKKYRVFGRALIKTNKYAFNLLQDMVSMVKVKGVRQ